MAGYSRYRRTSSTRYRTYRRYGGYRGYRRYRRTQYRAAASQRDSATVVIPMSLTKVLNFRDDTSYITGMLSVFNMLSTSEFASYYIKMYDQLKIESIKVKLNGLSQNISFASSALSNLRIYPTVYTAWDRNGLMINLEEDDVETNDITGYSSAYSKAWSTGSSFSSTRVLTPTTMAEKSQYIPTTSLTESDVVDMKQHLGLPFKPLYWYSIVSPISKASGDLINFTLSFEVEVVVKFRGLRVLDREIKEAIDAIPVIDNTEEIPNPSMTNFGTTVAAPTAISITGTTATAPSLVRYYGFAPKNYLDTKKLTKVTVAANDRVYVAIDGYGSCLVFYSDNNVMKVKAIVNANGYTVRASIDESGFAGDVYYVMLDGTTVFKDNLRLYSSTKALINSSNFTFEPNSDNANFLVGQNNYSYAVITRGLGE